MYITHLCHSIPSKLPLRRGQMQTGGSAASGATVSGPGGGAQGT